jgi:hypothetical protein
MNGRSGGVRGHLYKNVVGFFVQVVQKDERSEIYDNSTDRRAVVE